MMLGEIAGSPHSKQTAGNSTPESGFCATCWGDSCATFEVQLAENSWNFEDLPMPRPSMYLPSYIGMVEQGSMYIFESHVVFGNETSCISEHLKTYDIKLYQ